MVENKWETVGVFLVNRDNKVLLHLRDDRPSVFMRGMWTGLGGGIEKNETPEEATRRELIEEISFAPKELIYLCLYPHPDRVVHIYYTFVDMKDSSSLHLTEGQSLQFFSIEEVSELFAKGRTNADIVNQLVILKKMLFNDNKS